MHGTDPQIELPTGAGIRQHLVIKRKSFEKLPRSFEVQVSVDARTTCTYQYNITSRFSARLAT